KRDAAESGRDNDFEGTEELRPPSTNRKLVVEHLHPLMRRHDLRRVGIAAGHQHPEDRSEALELGFEIRQQAALALDARARRCKWDGEMRVRVPQLRVESRRRVTIEKEAAKVLQRLVPRGRKREPVSRLLILVGAGKNIER